MIGIGVTQWCLDCTGIDTVYRAADLGFSALQIDAGEPGKDGFLGDVRVQHAYRQAAQRAGIEITAIGLNIFSVQSMDDAETGENANSCWHVLSCAIEAAAAMNIGLVFLPSFYSGEIRTEQDLRITAAFLRRACLYAQERGVLVATENTLDDSGNRRLLALVDHPNIRVLLDALNPVLWGHHVPTLVKNLWPYLCNQVHAKDGVDGIMGNAPLGTGQAKFLETAQVLRALDFSGYLILENEYAQDTEKRVAQDVTVITQVFPQE